MNKKMLIHVGLALLLFWKGGAEISASDSTTQNSTGRTGTLEKMIVTDATVTMNFNLDPSNWMGSEDQELKRIRFHVDRNSFFTIRTFNGLLRGPDPGMLGLVAEDSRSVPEALRSLGDELVLEKAAPGGQFDLIIRAGKTGTTYFNIEGDIYDYDSVAHLLIMQDARLMVSEALAGRLGHRIKAGTVVGNISVSANVTPIQVTQFINGQVRSASLPPRPRTGSDGADGLVLGPDIVVGDLPSMVQAGNSGGQVGLGIATTSCNHGNREVHFFALPDTDHSVVSQNLYRMSGGANNNDRFEQIGQGWVKHTFGADQDNDCSFGCEPAADFTTLGPGCSDPYDAGENATYSLLGSRAWINPFTGVFPNTAASHSGHSHTATSHRVLVNASDLDTTQNAGATYWAEVTYDIRQEYDWCQAHSGECNMYNNASYRRFNVSGTTAFTFTPGESTVRMTPVIYAWTGATIKMFEPEPGIDGRAYVAYKVTNPSAGVWHYEYAVYNRNLDRAIQSFRVPLGTGITVSNLGFHAPQNPAGFPNDGTLNDAGFSNAEWTADQTGEALTWSSETFAQNPNANAIRWATMYNFRFDSNHPPYVTNATVGFLKVGTPLTVEIEAPIPDGATPSPSPQASQTPSATPGGSVTPTPTEPPGETPTPTPKPTPTPSSIAHALDLSSRVNVGTGNDVGIAGFIIAGTSPKQVLLRGIGPSLAGAGIANPLSDPVLRLVGTTGTLMTNNNWRDAQETQIMATGIAPTNDFEAAILATLDPGSYTAVLSGNQNGVGLGLVELYDLTDGSASKLANISTRAPVGTGDNIVIAGFILGDGSANDFVIIRALGGGIFNPRLELRDSAGNLIASDNDWQDDPEQAALISGAGLAPGDSLDAAIAKTLAPGGYTALVFGVNNTTGVGLLEVYDNPAGGPTPTPTPGGTPTPTPSGTPTPTPSGAPTPTPPGVTPSPTPSTCVENFDSVTPPALPPGWVASNPVPGDGVMWFTSTVAPDSPPNDVFIPDQNGISDKVLDRQNVTINTANSILTFRNNYDTEESGGQFCDGGVLEISTPNISHGDFLDFTDSHIGAACLTGCYNHAICGGASGPFPGGEIWAGQSGGYITTQINLGPNLSGQTITLRWRFRTDEAVAAPGWRIDTISISDASCP